MLLLLLLLEQLIETKLLLGSQDRTKIVFCLAQFFVDLFSGALLPFLEDFVDLLLLVGREVQLALDATQEVEPHAAGRDRGGLSVARGPKLARSTSARNSVFNQQTAGHHSRAENDHGCGNDSPGVHQGELESCLAAARTVFSKS